MVRELKLPIGFSCEYLFFPLDVYISILIDIYLCLILFFSIKRTAMTSTAVFRTNILLMFIRSGKRLSRP